MPNWGIDIEFAGKDENEEGVVIGSDVEVFSRFGLEAGKLFLSRTIVKLDPKYIRPIEVDALLGDPTKSKTQFGWEPKYNLAALVKYMVISDLHLMKTDEYLKEGCFFKP